MVYVVKHKGRYLRFGSYAKAEPVDRPENASLYSRLRDAENRKKRDVWIGRKSIPTDELEIYSVEFTWTETPVKNDPR